MTGESNATPELNFQNEIVPNRCSKFTMVHIYLEHLRTSWINGAWNKGQNGGSRINVLPVNEVDWWNLLNRVNMLNYKPTDVYSNQYCTNVVAWNSSSQVHHCSENTVRTVRSNCRDTHRYTMIHSSIHQLLRFWWLFSTFIPQEQQKPSWDLWLGFDRFGAPNPTNATPGGTHLATPFSTTHNWYLGGRFDHVSSFTSAPSAFLNPQNTLNLAHFLATTGDVLGFYWDFIRFYGDFMVISWDFGCGSGNQSLGIPRDPLGLRQCLRLPELPGGSIIPRVEMMFASSNLNRRFDIFVHIYI